jgi:hypothetical protein
MADTDPPYSANDKKSRDPGHGMPPEQRPAGSLPSREGQPEQRPTQSRDDSEEPEQHK